MANRLCVSNANFLPYEIYLETSWSSFVDAIQSLSLHCHRICVITDQNVSKLYLADIYDILKSLSIEVYDYVLPAGEEYKTLEHIQGIYSFLIEHHFDRQDVLVALGGGVVGDMTGFTAATYLRGIDFIQVPTTLLSQVDSSIGGKTGVDFSCYKNLIGAFKQPRLVYINMSVLRTLSDQQFASGMAEVIKHGCIRNADYLSDLATKREEILNREPSALAYVVLESLKIKRAIVETDPYEKGERALLNFGHTLGHALEKETYFSLTHGEGVSLGCVAAFYLSQQRGYLNKEMCQQLEQLFQCYHLPIRIGHINIDAVLKAVKHDKKMVGDKIRFILLHDIGEGGIDYDITEKDMKNALNYILED